MSVYKSSNILTKNCATASTKLKLGAPLQKIHRKRRPLPSRGAKPAVHNDGEMDRFVLLYVLYARKHQWRCMKALLCSTAGGQMGFRKRSYGLFTSYQDETAN